MNPVIRLQDFVQEMDVGLLSEEELRMAEVEDNATTYPPWQQESIQKASEVLGSDDYRPLPSQFDIHEYAIMKSYCYTVDDEALQRRLLRSIQGRGAFRYFKDTIHEHRIADDWYAYRQQAFREIAIEWLESHGVPYIDE